MKSREGDGDAVTDLDDDYANTAHIPDGASYPARWATKAQAFRAGAVGLLDQPYGAGQRQVFDMFLPDAPALGTVVFVHGGYWTQTDKSLWSHLAAGPLARGYAVALPSYDLCPAVRISAITRQIAQALDRIAAITGGPIILTGHSAGGHLVARMGCADVTLDRRDRIARIVPISPLSDLRPFLHLSMNADLRLDMEEAAQESPVLHPAPDVPVTILVGGAERPAFLDQARWLRDAWAAECLVIPDRHHFDIIAGLEDAGSVMTRAVLGLV